MSFISGPSETPPNDMLLSMRLASIFAHEEMQEGVHTSEVQQYLPHRRESHMLDYMKRSNIIKFLSENLFVMVQHGSASDVILEKFENTVSEATNKSLDKDLLAVLRNNGWNGKRFQMSSSVPFDPNALFLALLNLHLRSTDKEHPRKRSSFHIRRMSIMASSQRSHDSFEDPPNELEEFENQHENINEKQFYSDQVKSFCPSILLTHLRDRPIGEMLSVSSSTFQGACMLADISGAQQFLR